MAAGDGSELRTRLAQSVAEQRASAAAASGPECPPRNLGRPRSEGGPQREAPAPDAATDGGGRGELEPGEIPASEGPGHAGELPAAEKAKGKFSSASRASERRALQPSVEDSSGPLTWMGQTLHHNEDNPLEMQIVGRNNKARRKRNMEEEQADVRSTREKVQKLKNEGEKLPDEVRSNIAQAMDQWTARVGQ